MDVLCIFIFPRPQTVDAYERVIAGCENALENLLVSLLLAPQVGHLFSDTDFKLQ
jgi:hypothetical protein